MSVLAAIRPDEWNFPLFIHILGAMVSLGALVLAASSLSKQGGMSSILQLSRNCVVTRIVQKS